MKSYILKYRVYYDENMQKLTGKKYRIVCVTTSFQSDEIALEVASLLDAEPDAYVEELYNKDEDFTLYNHKKAIHNNTLKQD